MVKQAYNLCKTEQERKKVASIEQELIAKDKAKDKNITSLLDQAYQLCENQDERIKVKATEKAITALSKKYNNDKAKSLNFLQQ